MGQFNDYIEIFKIEKRTGFTYLDQLINSGQKEITLNRDVILEEGEEEKYPEGVLIDVDDIVIDGNGHTIDARGKTRIFQVTGKNITLKNITLKNGYNKDYGGAILNWGQIKTQNTILTNNTALQDGGAINNHHDGTITLTNTTLQENTAGSGGAIHNKGTINIQDTTLKNNTAQWIGGAIHNKMDGTITLTNTTLENNTAKEIGGAIHNREGTITLTNTTLENNTATGEDGQGGAIDNYGTITLTDTTLTYNTAERYGGAIHNNGTINIQDTTLTNNIAERYGGAIYNLQGTITITNTTLTNNTAQYNGGAIDNSGTIILTDTTLQENTAQQDGGAIHNYGTITLTNTTLTNNTGQLIENKGIFKIFNSEISNNSFTSNIVENENYLEISDTTFNNNESHGIIHNDLDDATVGIFNSDFIGNKIEKYIIYNDGKSGMIKNSLFEDNLQNNSKNIINNSNLTLVDPKINNNGKSIVNNGHTILSSEDLESKLEGEGTVEILGIIPTEEKFDFGYLDKKIHENTTKEIVLEEDICFANYEKEFYEGGIELDIDNLIIDGNGHTIDGADKTRIFIITGNNITLRNITFKNGHSYKNPTNNLNNSGGAIRNNHNKNLTIENCILFNNSSEENGGAINNKGTINIQDTTLSNNTATGKHGLGGAIINFGEINILDTTLTNNTAQNGGAIHNIMGRTITITNTTLQENTAQYNGGAIHNDGTITLTDTTLTNNTAERYGGAIHNWIGIITITNTTLQENTAQYNGGAIHNDGTITLTDTTLTNNTAERYGGAIHNKMDGTITLTDTTLTNNTADSGGAIYPIVDDNIKLENCDIRDNKPEDIY